MLSLAGAVLHVCYQTYQSSSKTVTVACPGAGGESAAQQPDHIEEPEEDEGPETTLEQHKAGAQEATPHIPGSSPLEQVNPVPLHCFPLMHIATRPARCPSFKKASLMMPRACSKQEADEVPSLVNEEPAPEMLLEADKQAPKAKKGKGKAPAKRGGKKAAELHDEAAAEQVSQCMCAPVHVWVTA